MPNPSPSDTALFLVFPLTRADSHHLLRALTRAAAVAVSDAVPDERRKATADADAYDAIRGRLLTEIVRRDAVDTWPTKPDTAEAEV